ncbi:hypothetical protein PI124_g19443 [Phytophthora idaei]|nr:hypothetical protein PI124_g19443 [Phytophthora idaei]
MPLSFPATQDTTPGTHETAPLRKKRKVSPGNESDSVERTQPSTPSHAAYITLAVVPRIAGKTFTAWTEFFAFWDQFEREQSAVYRTRDCQTAKLYNITRTNHPQRQVPDLFGYAFRKYVCTLGCKQKPRSTGKRAKRKEWYRACKAMFRVAVVRAHGCGVQSSSNWIIKVTSEHPCQDHVNAETLYAALKQCKDLLSDSVLSMLDAFGQTNTDTKQKVSYVAGTAGLPITTQQVRNLINARLGHGNAEQRLKAVLTEFASTEDYEGVLLQGDWDPTVRIGPQTKAQRKIFSRWGDTLALDWTHSCTNLGFYVGTLVATVPTGRGVSILDYLFLNQRKTSLLVLLKWLKMKNPSWGAIAEPGHR